MIWRKLGRIFVPAGNCPWAQSHASVPIAEHITEDRFRIYYTSRDVENRSHVSWYEMDLNNPAEVLEEATQPVLAPGKLGSFDMDGVMASTLVQHGNESRLYYIGWNRSVGVPFRNAIGLAIRETINGTFKRVSDGPVLDRGLTDPYFLSSHDVLIDEASWHMWYLSGLDWLPSNPPASTYNLRYALSEAGIVWQRHGLVAIRFAHRNEIAIARPTVIRDGCLWRMWFCYRGTDFPYQIGYAESEDAVEWMRQDAKAGISASETGWDSEMICYPHVFDHGGRRYMLYNGNGFGASGIGLAILE